MTEQLSALDATFLELEQADATAHMHIGGILVFEPFPEGGAPSIEQLRDRLELRLPLLPRFTQRLSDPSVSGLRRPHWIRDDGFRLDAHVRRAALPAPGGETELLAWAGNFYSHRLDRRLPLWELVLVEGLEGGRWAIATKTHHCLADGIGSLDVTLLFEDRPPTPEPVARRGRPAPSATDAVAAALDLVRHPRQTAGQLEALAELVVREELIGAPQTTLNVPLGQHRRLAAARTTLDEIAAIRRFHGGTLNDVVLTAVTTGLRDLLLARGEAPPDGGLRAMVPVSVRPGRDGALGNRVSSRFVALPVVEPQLERRHQLVMAASRAAKHGHQPSGAATLLGLAEHLPPVLHSTFARSSFGARLFNLTITNVPGPPQVASAFHAPLTDIVPIVPLAAEHAVGVAVISYAGGLTFCVNADRDAVPDAQLVADGITRALARLRATAEQEVPA